MVVEGFPFFYVKIGYYVTSVFCNIRLLFFALPCIYKKKFVSLQREPTMGVCEWWGSCTLRCEQINICGYI